MSEHPNKLTIGKYNIDLLKKIGRGSFGTVYGVYTNDSKSPSVVAKECSLQIYKDRDRLGNQIVNEIKSMRQLGKHPHVMELLDFHYKNESFWLIMMFCELGDLNILFKKGIPEFSVKKNIMYQVATAVDFMHNNRQATVVHRDLKPSNILLHQHKEEIVAKVTDFGLAKILKIDEAETLTFASKVGTPSFMAPEFFSEDEREKKKSVDIFALGCIFLAMLIYDVECTRLSPLCGETKYHMGHEMEMRKSNGKQLKRYTDVMPTPTIEHKELKTLVDNMIQYAPGDRCPAQDVVLSLRSLGTSPYVLPNPSGTHKDEIVREPKITARERGYRDDTPSSSASATIASENRPMEIYPYTDESRKHCYKVGIDGNMLSEEEAELLLQDGVHGKRVAVCADSLTPAKTFVKYDTVKMIDNPTLAKVLQCQTLKESSITSQIPETCGVNGIVLELKAMGHLAMVQFATGKQLLVSVKILDPVDFSACQIEKGDYVLACRQGMGRIQQHTSGDVRELKSDQVLVYDGSGSTLEFSLQDLKLIAKKEDRAKAGENAMRAMAQK